MINIIQKTVVVVFKNEVFSNCKKKKRKKIGNKKKMICLTSSEKDVSISAVNRTKNIVNNNIYIFFVLIFIDALKMLSFLYVSIYFNT